MQVDPNLPQWLIVAIPIVAIWDVVWKGLALWRAARLRQTAWFVVLMILNTVGILPIVYLLLTKGAAESDAPAPR